MEMVVGRLAGLDRGGTRLLRVGNKILKSKFRGKILILGGHFLKNPKFYG
jgi:hypothetical protein